jgi:heme oxygenase (mycobilin-producing)
MAADPAVTPITAFEVPADADEEFIAAWDRVAGEGRVALYRALRADVDFRFVSMGEVADAASPAFTAHQGRYEVAREDGAVDTAGGVVLINLFEVGEDGDGRFLAGWDGARGVLAAQQGYIGTRLHRSAGPADFRFVIVARWSSPLMFARALQRPEFQEAAAAMPFPSHPALYQAVRG